MKRFGSLLVAAGIAAASVSTASAQYRFAAIATFAADPYPFMQEPAINAEGVLAFMHAAPNSSPAAEGLYLSGGGPALAIVRSRFVDSRGHSLNDFGQTAYVDSADGNVYRAGPLGHRTLIAQPEEDPEFSFYNPSINDRGTVAYMAQLDEDGNTAVFLGRGGEETVISHAEEGPLDYHSPPVINNRDEVAFSAYDTTTLSGGVYVFRRGTITRLYASGSDPVLNDRGVVAFTRFGSIPGSSTVLRGNGGPLTTIADSTGPFVSVFATDINDAGLVAFRAGLLSGGQAVYVGDGRRLQRVAGTGDVVLGKTITAVSGGSINQRGQVALDARFSDGTSAILRATPR